MYAWKTVICLLLVLLGAGAANAAPYVFSRDLNEYTWGEGVGKVKEILGEPYSQEPGGLTYLMSGKWMKQVLTYQDKVYQIIERMIYSLADPAAEREYQSIKQHLRELYGAPSQDDVACPNPQPSVKCRITRWDQHPSTQVFVAFNQDNKVVSVMLGVTSRQLRNEALASPENKQTLSVGQIIGAYQQNQAQAAAKYGGQAIKVMGQAGGIVKDEGGRIYIRVLNPFKASQQLYCYFPAAYGTMGPPPEGAVIITGVVGAYSNGVLTLENCTLALPAE